MIIKCYIDDRTREIMERESLVSGRTVEELAEAAISETALMSIHPSLRGRDLYKPATGYKLETGS